MTISEYEIRMEAYQLQQVEKLNYLATQAWFNQTVKATEGSKKHPKPKFKHLEDFFEYQNAIDKVRVKYEPRYKPKSLISQGEERTRIFAKRHEEFEKLWSEKRISRKRGG